MRIALVVAVARNGIIGANDTLPWHLPSELKRFKQITIGHPCIMGRKTFEGILARLKRPLPGRDSIVMTRQQGRIAVPGVFTAHDMRDALALGRKLARERGVYEVMVIGGGEIYRQALPHAERIYLTRVDMDAEGDTTFPELDSSQWRETARDASVKQPGEAYAYTTLILDRNV